LARGRSPWRSGVNGDANGTNLVVEDAGEDKLAYFLIPAVNFGALVFCGDLGSVLKALACEIGTASPAGLSIFDGAIAVSELQIDGVAVGACCFSGEDLAVFGSGSDLVSFGGHESWEQCPFG